MGAFALTVSFPTSWSCSLAHHRAPHVFAAFTTLPLCLPRRRCIFHIAAAFSMSSFHSTHHLCLPITVVILVGHHCWSCGRRWPSPGCTTHVQNSWAQVFDRRGAVGWGRGGHPRHWLTVAAQGSPIEPSLYPSSSCGLHIVLIPPPCHC